MNVFNFIKSNVAILDVIQNYICLEEVDGVYVGFCPLKECPVKNVGVIANFKVNPNKGMFYCFDCHKGGDIISFIQDIRNITPNKAALFIIEEYIMKKDK